MLEITVPRREISREFRDRVEFIEVPETTLHLEHSLLSISKWEAKWKKPFLDKTEKSVEETRDYVRCMTLDRSVDPNVYLGLTNANMVRVKAYIDDPMTASWISQQKEQRKLRSQKVTSELIYSWMVAGQIPFEVEKWHFNRLMMLIQICGENNKTDKHKPRRSAKDRRALNARRKAALGTRG